MLSVLFVSEKGTGQGTKPSSQDRAGASEPLAEERPYRSLSPAKPCPSPHCLQALNVQVILVGSALQPLPAGPRGYRRLPRLPRGRGVWTEPRQARDRKQR